MIKRAFLLPFSYTFLLLYLSGCTLVSTIEEGFVSLTQSFSEADEIEEAEIAPETNKVMESTRPHLRYGLSWPWQLPRRIN